MRRILIICLLLLASISWAADLQWNASVVDAEHPAPEGYRIHRGAASGVYTNEYDAGNALQWHIPDDWYGSFYFVASAYIADRRSGYSNEVFWQQSPPQQFVGATNLRASKLQRTPMAVALAGTVYQFDTDSSPQTVTVPSDATLAMVHVGRYNINGTQSFAINSVSFTQILSQSGTFDGALHRLVNPATGSQSFSWTCQGDWGPVITLAFFSGVDTTSPIRDSDYVADGGGSDIAVESPSLTVSAGDMVFIGLSSYGAGAEPDLAAYSGQSEIASPLLNDNVFGVCGTKAISSGTSTTVTGYGRFPMLVAAVIASGGASAVPKIMLLQDHFSGGIH